ncbi:MAG: hypothetical protein ACHQIO_03730 [Nevskiales bacterium]
MVNLVTGGEIRSKLVTVCRRPPGWISQHPLSLTSRRKVMDMLKNVALALGIVAVGAGLGACNKNETPPANAATSPSAPATAPADSMSSSSSSSSGGAAMSGGSSSGG